MNSLRHMTHIADEIIDLGASNVESSEDVGPMRGDRTVAAQAPQAGVRAAAGATAHRRGQGAERPHPARLARKAMHDEGAATASLVVMHASQAADSAVN